ncbi:MAG: hypothetical protein Q4C97_11725 [Bacillota bacterium]|nr:hypothetical protein [Bacillota bacterium]
MKINELYTAIKIQELMDLVRDSEKVRIFESMSESNPKTREDFESCVLGLQVDKIPDVQPTEPAIWIDELIDPEDLPEEPKQEEPDPHIGIPDSIPNSEDPAPLEGRKEGQSGGPGKGLGIT